MPGELLRSLVEEMRTLLRDPGGGVLPGGFEGREVEVLRLLAEGLDTTEIAVKLNYSERTIKNILFAVTQPHPCGRLRDAGGRPVSGWSPHPGRRARAVAPEG